MVTNAASPSPGLSLDPVTLTVLADTDHDGLPDDWEAAHGLNTNNPADALIDSDADGRANWQEYLAGTDPNAPQSFFKVGRIVLGGDEAAAVIQFAAVSNKTYTLQSKGSLTVEAWQRLVDVVALPTNRTVSITNALNGAARRYYRLVTPQTSSSVGAAHSHGKCEKRGTSCLSLAPERACCTGRSAGWRRPATPVCRPARSG